MKARQYQTPVCFNIFGFYSK